MELSQIKSQNIVQSLQVLNDPMSTSQLRKAADQYLLDCQKTSFSFLAFLLEIFEMSKDPVIRLQALLYFNNIVKRNWNNKRMNKNSPNFQSEKVQIKARLVFYLKNSDNLSRKSLLDIIVFISKFDFPHNYESLCQFILQVYRNINNSQVLLNEHLSYLKAVKEVYKEQLLRKSSVSSKSFAEVNVHILGEAFKMFNNYSTKLSNPDSITPNQWKLMRNNDKILLMLIITGPSEIVDQQSIINLVGFIEQKLTALVQLIAASQHPISGEAVQKSVKTLLEYLGYLQNIHPFILTKFLKVYLQILSYLYLNYGQYKSKDILRYVIINLQKVMKCFNYYSEDSSFLASSHSKSNKSINYPQYHQTCRIAFFQVFTQEMIEKILSQSIVKILTVREHQLEVGCGVEDEDAKVEDKQNTIFNLAMYLIDIIFVRFSPYALHLFRDLVVNSVASRFSNMNEQMLNNIFAIMSIIPKACRGENAGVLNQIPITLIIEYIHSTNKYKDKFALLCCKWLNRFSNEDLRGILNILVMYVSTEQKIEVLLECCLAIKTIVLEKSSEIDITFAVQKIIPIAIRLCSTVESTQVVWPMITLISKMISKIQFNLHLLLEAFTSQSLSKLLQQKSQLVVQALCDMIKNLICVFPRNMQIPVIYQIAFTFIDNHVGHPNFASFTTVLMVWYISIRQYSSIQGLDVQARNLFEKHYSKLICTQNQTLLYILQEYVLLRLIQSDITSYTSLLNEFYFEHEFKEDTLNLKTAVMSVHITFISMPEYGIQKAHSTELLVKYLGDMAMPVNIKSKSMATFRNSLITLINRYLILFKDGFLTFVDKIGLGRMNFFPIWFDHMEYLTSRSACKINAIALLRMLNDLDIGLIRDKLEYIFKLIVPEIELYKATRQDNIGTATTKIGVSPTNRLSENILSERKEEIRRTGVFQNIDMDQQYKTEVSKFLQRNGINKPQIVTLFADKALAQKLYQLLLI